MHISPIHILIHDVCYMFQTREFILRKTDVRAGMVYDGLRVTIRGHAVAQLVETPRYKSEGRGFDSR
jgi:hypothetical protein